MRVICISAKAQNGKDYCAELIKTELENKNKKVLITHYADVLKYLCKTFFNWNGEKDEEGRHLLQYVGTDVIRAKQPDFFTDFLINVLKVFVGQWDYVLIPDCRFPNEIDAMKKEFDTISVRIIRFNEDGTLFSNNLTAEAKLHISETSLDDYDFDVYIANKTNSTSGVDIINQLPLED